MPDHLAAQAYAGVMIFTEAARHANLTFSGVVQDRTRLRNALATVDLDTPMGPLGFTSQHDFNQTIRVWPWTELAAIAWSSRFLRTELRRRSPIVCGPRR